MTEMFSKLEADLRESVAVFGPAVVEAAMAQAATVVYEGDLVVYVDAMIAAMQPVVDAHVAAEKEAAMTEKETELYTLLYALGSAIEKKDWANALPMWEALLNLHAPLAEMQPHLGTVLQNGATMTQLAEKQSTKIH